MGKKLLVVIILTTILVIAGIVLLLKPGENTPPKNQPPTDQQKSSTSLIIDISLAGFSPGTVTVAKGTKVELKNSTSSEIEIASQDSQFKIPQGGTYPLPINNSGQFKFTSKNNNQTLLIVVQ